MVARCHTTVTVEWLVLFYVHQMRTSTASRAVVLNKFRDMEKDVVDALKPLLPPIYNVGPLTSAIASPLPAPDREWRHGHPAVEVGWGVHGVAGWHGWTARRQALLCT